MSVLVHSQIKRRCEDERLIDPFLEEHIEGASYDLRLGPRVVKGGEVKIVPESSPTVIIQSGEFVVLSSLEKINMPLDLVGHTGVKLSWAARGLVTLFSPQIDPGFSGMLAWPVFNVSSQPISLNLGDTIFTVEFVQTATEVEESRAWSRRHSSHERRFDTFVSTSSVSVWGHYPEIQRNVTQIESDFSDLAQNLAYLKSINEHQFNEISARMTAIDLRLKSLSEQQTMRVMFYTLIFTVIACLITFFSIPLFRDAL